MPTLWVSGGEEIVVDITDKPVEELTSYAIQRQLWADMGKRINQTIDRVDAILAKNPSAVEQIAEWSNTPEGQERLKKAVEVVSEVHH